MLDLDTISKLLKDLVDNYTIIAETEDELIIIGNYPQINIVANLARMSGQAILN